MSDPSLFAAPPYAEVQEGERERGGMSVPKKKEENMPVVGDPLYLWSNQEDITSGPNSNSPLGALKGLWRMFTLRSRKPLAKQWPSRQFVSGEGDFIFYTYVRHYMKCCGIVRVSLSSLSLCECDMCLYYIYNAFFNFSQRFVFNTISHDSSERGVKFTRQTQQSL